MKRTVLRKVGSRRNSMVRTYNNLTFMDHTTTLISTLLLTNKEIAGKKYNEFNE